MDAAENAEERRVGRENTEYTISFAADWFTDEIAVQVNRIYTQGETKKVRAYKMHMETSMEINRCIIISCFRYRIDYFRRYEYRPGVILIANRNFI